MSSGCPHLKLHDPAFHADPHTAYGRMAAEHGHVYRAEIAPGIKAWIVADYSTIIAWCRDPHTFKRDSRLWRDWREGKVPEDAPIAAMMGYRDNLLFNDGEGHSRLKRTITDSLGRIPESDWAASARAHADRLVDAFIERGNADLVAEYARLLPLLVLCDMFGFSPEIGQRVLTSLSDLWDGVNAAQANADYERALSDAVSAKHRTPANDITTWMIEHRAGLSDEELLQQLVVTIGAGAEPTANLITTTTRVLLTDREVGRAVAGARIGISDAIDQVLWRDPPITNFPILYPVRDVDLGRHGVIRAGDPVVLGYAAAQSVLMGENGPGIEEGNRAHLAFGAGPHRCPAQGFATAIAHAGVEVLLNRLPGIRIPVDEPRWRPSPFARALADLPVEFTPDTPKGASPWTPTTSSPSSTPTTSTGRPPASAGSGRSSGLRSLVAWLFGR